MPTSSARDAHAAIRYLDPEVPRTDRGLWRGFIDCDNTVPGQIPYSLVTNPCEVTVLDARTHNGGLDSWNLDEHGFSFIPAPEPVLDFRDGKLVLAEYQPRVLEAVKKHTNASRIFWMGHVRRGESAAAQLRDARTGSYLRTRGNYADLAHSDYGPEYEPLFRRMLGPRYGIPEEETKTCGLCVIGFWAPVENPAYKDPLCLLDSSTLRLESEVLTYMNRPGNIGYGTGDKKPPVDPRDAPKRLPRVTQDAPSVGPRYAPSHRWVYCPDMRPEEAVIFKQYDFRPPYASSTPFAAHSSFHDRFHEAWEGCPPRRSIECRLLLTFNQASAEAPRFLSRF